MTSTSPRSQKRPDHIITINYVVGGGEATGPVPRDLHIKASESFAFRGKFPRNFALMQVAFDNPQHFSVPTFREGDPPITVSADLPNGEGGYRCQLVSDDGEAIDVPDIRGGGIFIDR